MEKQMMFKICWYKADSESHIQKAFGNVLLTKAYPV